jgi:hypothetical protein
VVIEDSARFCPALIFSKRNDSRDPAPAYAGRSGQTSAWTLPRRMAGT